MHCLCVEKEKSCNWQKIFKKGYESTPGIEGPGSNLAKVFVVHNRLNVHCLCVVKEELSLWQKKSNIQNPRNRIPGFESRL
jgi:hypothetical protein